MKKEFNQQDNALNRQKRALEKRLIQNYSQSLKEVRSQLAKLYEQTDGDFTEANKYNRLANLEKKISQEIAKLTGKNANSLKAGIASMYAESFYRTAYVIDNQARKVGIQLSFGLLNPKVIEKAIDNPFDRYGKGKVKGTLGWLRRNRDNQQVLTRQLQEQITQGLVQGKSYQKTAKALKERFNTATYKAMRIAQTESHRVQQAARLDGLNEASNMGVIMKKQWMSTLDGNTRDVHQNMDGETVDTDKPFIVNGEYLQYPGDPVGSPENVINCRCTSVGIIEGYEPKVRKARDEDGKSVLVPYQNYNEWRKTLE